MKTAELIKNIPTASVIESLVPVTNYCFLLKLEPFTSPNLSEWATRIPTTYLDLPKTVESSSKRTPPQEKPQLLETEFDRLATAWKAVARGPQSSVSRIVTHPAYLEIISYGEKVIPFILRDLQKEPNHWFIALKILAKQFSPVKPEDAGNIKKMTEAWLEWGRKNGNID